MPAANSAGSVLRKALRWALSPIISKVNAICPRNYLTVLCGPTRKGPVSPVSARRKVPGAKLVADVKKFYESKVPMDRGCFPQDVGKGHFLLRRAAI